MPASNKYARERQTFNLYAVEDCRPDQVEALMAIAEAKNRPIGELVIEALRLFLGRLSQEDRSSDCLSRGDSRLFAAPGR